jgi:hypothetical protein
MKANFLRLREFLLNEYPGQWNSIEGGLYPAPEWTKYASSLLSAVQMFTMVVALVGDSAWTYVPGVRTPPDFYFKMKENATLTFIIVFLVIPSYVQSFAATAAFEIFVDDKLVRPTLHAFVPLVSVLDTLHPSCFTTTDLFEIRDGENATFF